MKSKDYLEEQVPSFYSRCSKSIQSVAKQIQYIFSSDASLIYCYTLSLLNIKADLGYICFYNADCFVFSHCFKSRNSSSYIFLVASISPAMVVISPVILFVIHIV